jgi:anti-sigma factor RsiW
MSCSPFDLRDYFLRELTNPRQLQVEAHLETCPSCREELDRLRVTQTALFALREEEIPQRIGFVSDKIFEPSPWRRFWAAFWGSGARLGFASAAMLSAALLVSALTRPAPAPLAQTRSTVATAGLSSAEIESRIQAAVQKAALEIEARQEKKTAQLVRDIELRDQAKLHNVVALADAQFDYYRQRYAGANQ